MALPAASVWEVRPTVGSDTNGGGFVTGSSGSDYSQQNSKNTSGSDISTTDAVAVGTTTLTSATANFSTAIPGNIIFLSGSGITAGWYEVVSRTNGTTVVLDRSPGTGTSLTMNIGGALATVSQAATNSVASNVVWVKASGTYTVTLDAHDYDSIRTLSPGTPFSIIGYTSTRGDNGQFTWTTATNSIDLIDMNQAANVLLQNIIFTNTAGTPGDGLFSGASGSANSVGVVVINCKFSGFTVGIEGNFTSKWAFAGLFVVNSRITGCVSHGIRNGASTYILGCMLDNNGGDGLNTATSQAPESAFVLENSIFYKNSGNGFNIAFSNAGGTAMDAITVRNCDFSTNTGAGILSSNVTNPLPQISNCIFDANGTYGIDTGSATITASILLYNNAFYNNTTAATRGVNAGLGTVTLTASPYTTLGSNFALNSTSGGGAACKGAGFPGTIPGGGSGSADIGALQSSGGGSTTVQVIAPTQIRILKNDRR